MSRPTTLSIRLELLLPAAAIQNSKKTDLFKVIGIAVASGVNSKFEKKGRSTDKDPSIQIGIAVASGGNSKFEKKKVFYPYIWIKTLSIQFELLLPAAAIQNSKKKRLLTDKKNFPHVYIYFMDFQFNWNCCCHRREFKIRKKKMD